MAARKGETTKFRVSVGLYQNSEKIIDFCLSLTVSQVVVAP